MIIPIGGMVIRRDTVFQPGVYFLPQGISIVGDNVTLDGNGALLIGQKRSGRGVTINGRKNVTIKNLRLIEFEHGIYARGCRELTIRNCQITATNEIPPNTIFLDIWRSAQDPYGGGIMLWDVEDSQIVENDLQHQMVGLLTYNCKRLNVQRNLANYCSGFGFHLYGTSDSAFDDNFADYCCRYQPRGERAGHMGADAAGFLIVAGASRNTFRRNFARMGGDSFFIAGLNPRYEFRPCNDNLFEANDASLSPNIGFEATFCQGNTFRDNYANGCNYGFWLGFSGENTLENNQMYHNRQAGIAVENGYDFKARQNFFYGNTHGILLWSKRVAAFDSVVPKNDTSRHWLIENNTFIRNDKAIRIAADQDHGTRPIDPGAPLPHSHTLRKNAIRDNRVGVELLRCERTLLDDNIFEGNVEADQK
jgi:parallel beta-helix repeat protein